VVKVLDKDSQEVIREIPPKEFREVAQALQEVADKLSNSKGVLFNDTV
jgi:flagellar protein FlaG